MTRHERSRWARRRAGLVLPLVALLLAGCGPAGGGAAAPSPSPSDPGLAADDFAEQGIIRGEQGDMTKLSWTTLDAHQAFLVGPHFDVAAAAVTTVPELSPAQIDGLGLSLYHLPPGEPLRAGTGHEFVVVRGGHNLIQVPDVSGLPESVQLLVNGTARDLSHALPLASKDMTLVVNAPTGAAVVLQVTDAGRTQSMNLRTGQVDGAIPLLHPPLGDSATLQDIIHVSTPSGITPPGKGAYSELTLEASLLPWTKDKGWAAGGRAWLVLEVYGLSLSECDIALDLGRSLTLRTAAGQALPVTGTITSTFPAAGAVPERVTQVFDVPENTRSLSAAFVTRGVVTVDGKAATWSRYPDPKSQAKIDLVPPRS